jgi:hypothetical protein
VTAPAGTQEPGPRRNDRGRIVSSGATAFVFISVTNDRGLRANIERAIVARSREWMR